MDRMIGPTMFSPAFFYVTNDRSHMNFPPKFVSPMASLKVQKKMKVSGKLTGIGP